MTKHDNSKPSAGSAAVVTPAAAGGPSTPAVALSPDARRETPSRDGLVLVCIAVVSAAISMMFFIQFGLSLPVSLIAGAIGWTVFMLIHKQFQKSAQIAQLKAELTHSRAQTSKPRSAGPRVAPTGPLGMAPPLAADARAPGFGALTPRPELAQPAPAASAPELARPLPGEVRAGLAGDSPGRQHLNVAAAQPEPSDQDPRFSPELTAGPSVAAGPPADALSSERRMPQSEAIRDHWSFRPRVDAHDPSSLSGASLGAAGPVRPGTTIEGDLELVQRKIKELADEVNATEALRAARPQRGTNQGRINKDRLASNVLEDSIGALKAAAGSMRERAAASEFVPTLSMPPIASPASAKPDAPQQQLGELVIPATAERIAGSDAGSPPPPEVRKADIAPAPFEMQLPDFPLIDFPSGPAPTPALPARAAAIARAVEDNAIDVFLAPIVTLAEHSVSHYEMAVELRSAAGERLEANDEDFALIGGELDARFDIARLNRAAALALRMEARDKDGALLTEFMGTSLTSRAFLESFAHVYEARPAVAAQLVLTLPQRAIDEFAPAAWQAVRDMHAFGFRFALNRIEHMSTDFASLAHSGFRFVKFEAPALLDGVAARDRFVPADEVYQRVTLAGLTIIAGGIGDAAAQRRLLATGVLLGQGPLFGAPRRLSLDGVAPSAQSAAA